MGIMDQANEFLKSPEGSQKAEEALQRGADFANQKTDNKYADQIGQAQEAARNALSGQQGQAQPGQQTQQPGQQAQDAAAQQQNAAGNQQ